MPAEILTIPCLQDNYAYAILDTASGDVAVIDVPEAAPILRTLAFKGWSLNQILLTHHHGDHIAGVELLTQAVEAPVVGAKADMARLPPLALGVEEGDAFALGHQPVYVYDVSGHTVGHLAYYFPEAEAVFTGDSLMVMGCGRLFEGDAQTMWNSLSKLMDLPPETEIYSGHEYTAANAKFAMSIEPENKALIDRVRQISESRARGDDTMGATLAQEMATNPFLRAGRPEVKAALGMDGAEDWEVFAEIRRRKDNF
jgi:hydroxyacylglutathione hydrolase